MISVGTGFKVLSAFGRIQNKIPLLKLAKNSFDHDNNLEVFT